MLTLEAQQQQHLGMPNGLCCSFFGQIRQGRPSRQAPFLITSECTRERDFAEITRGRSVVASEDVKAQVHLLTLTQPRTHLMSQASQPLEDDRQIMPLIALRNISAAK